MENKKEYVVYITETLQRKVIVEAETLTEAEEIVSKQYYDGEIELNYLDYVSAEFEATEKKHFLMFGYGTMYFGCHGLFKKA